MSPLLPISPFNPCKQRKKSDKCRCYYLKFLTGVPGGPDRPMGPGVPYKETNF